MTISDAARGRGVTRVCHLSPFRNLLYIARGSGVRSVTELQADERNVFTRQDLQRYDAHPGHISCSLQYPNVWYLAQKLKVLSPEQLFFPDWVCLFIDPVLLDEPGVKFSPVNAATAGGARLSEGLAAFEAMFADPVHNNRGPLHRAAKPDSCPTDDQAEVMLPKLIPVGAVRGVAVRSEELAARIYGALDLDGGAPERFAWTVAPDLFTNRCSALVRSGTLPAERPWSTA